MRSLMSLALAAAMVAGTTVLAEEVKSGLKEGESVGAFYVTKCAGAEEDSVPVGENLCYRCKNGARPQVMIFTRSADDKIVSLLKKLDTHLQKNEDAQLRAFVNMLGDSKDAAVEEVKKLAKTSDAKLIPFVVPNEFENGPENYGLNPKAELTIIFANDSKVVANYSLASAKDLKVDEVESNLKKILN